MTDPTAEYLEKMLLLYRGIKEKGMSLYVARKRGPDQNMSELFALPDPARETDASGAAVLTDADREEMIRIFGYSEFPEQFDPYIKERRIYLFALPEYREALSVEAFQKILAGDSACIQCDTIEKELRKK